MKVFLSWSGSKSQRTAKALADWLPCVVQAVDPWISSKDIDRGSIWFNEILEQLKDTHFGIVLVTKENQDKSWLMFESGALSKGLAENRVCTVLVDLNVRDIDSGSPLHQLNHSGLDKEGLLSLVRTINKKLDTGQLQDKRLEQTFSAMWPDLASKIDEILKSDPAPKTPERTDKDVLNDILENVLTINRRVSSASSARSQKYIEMHHATALIKNLLKMGHDRGDILEAIDGIVPERWASNHISEYLGKDPEEEEEEQETPKGTL